MTTALTVAAHLTTAIFPWAGATIYFPAYLFVMAITGYIGVHPLFHLLLIVPALLLLLLVIMPLAMTALGVMWVLKVRSRDVLILPTITVAATAAACVLLGALYLAAAIYKATMMENGPDEQAYLAWASAGMAAGIAASARVGLTSARRARALLAEGREETAE